MKKILLLFVLPILVYRCTPTSETGQPLKIDSLQLTNYLSQLASDEFLGRMPFSEGEEITVNYIKEEMIKAGIEPGNGDSYFQDAKLVMISSERQKKLNINTESGQIELNFLDDFVGGTTRIEEKTNIEESELVFAGYGIVAPEYGWNDYEGIDMKGKTAVVIVNDPGFRTKVDSLFKGNAMTYYGRWTYKYEEAARQGADGVLIIHENDAAGYPWSVVRGGWGGDQMVLDLEHKNLKDCKLNGWISKEKATELFDAAGLFLGTEMAKAFNKGFKPFSLNATYSFGMDNNLEFNSSKNVIGKVTGTKYPDEVIIFSGHWDHFGIGEKIDGDSIYNGAVDNGTGTAAIMEIGRQFVQARPERTIVILAVTAEEQGLLGSQYYAENPIYPIDKTVANMNIDAIGSYGRTSDMEIIGYGQSQMDDYAKTICDKYAIEIVPDQNTEKGYFFRSDHIHFAKQGIPCFYGKTGVKSITKGAEWGKKQHDLYRQENYHAPSDNFDENFDMGGVIQMSQIMLEMTQNLANSRDFPEWKVGADFKR
ncbi:MAG: M28 family peptidase [Reichenbachiella sp.]